MLHGNLVRAGCCVTLLFAPLPEFLHVKPGKGAAFVRTKLRNYITGNTVEKTFRAGESVRTWAKGLFEGPSGSTDHPPTVCRPRPPCPFAGSFPAEPFWGPLRTAALSHFVAGSSWQAV